MNSVGFRDIKAKTFNKRPELLWFPAKCSDFMHIPLEIDGSQRNVLILCRFRWKLAMEVLCVLLVD